MGTPCRCCGKKVACKTVDLRFDHDRYKHFAVRGFLSLKQEVFRKVNDSDFTKLSEENFEFSDEEAYACNIVLEGEESRDAFINGQTVVETIKTVSTVVRKFVLVYQIDDVFDWEDKNIKGESLINNIRIRTGHAGRSYETKPNPPSPISIPGACESGPYFGTGGEYCVKRGVEMPISLQEFDNLFSDGVSFDVQDRIINQGSILYEVGLIIPEDIVENVINENNTYFVLVQCDEGSVVEFGKWGNPQDGGCGGIDNPVVSNTTFLELQRITSLREPPEKVNYYDDECYDNYMQFHGIPQLGYGGAISREEEYKQKLLNEITDWHDYFVRTANGEYYSKNSYMDADLDLSNFILNQSQSATSSDMPTYFQYCGTLELLIRDFETGETYLNSYYDMSHREVKGLLDLSEIFRCGCLESDRSWSSLANPYVHFEKGYSPENDIFKVIYRESCDTEEEWQEFSVTRKEIEDIASMKKYPDRLSPHLTRSPVSGSWSMGLSPSPYVIESTPDHNKFIQTFRYRVGERTMPNGDVHGSGPDRFEGRAYIMNEFITHYKDCTEVSCIDRNYYSSNCEIKKHDIEEKPCCKTYRGRIRYDSRGIPSFDKSLIFKGKPDRYGNINESNPKEFGVISKVIDPQGVQAPFDGPNGGNINNIYIRKCVIESTGSQIVSGMASTFKDQPSNQGNPKGNDKANLAFSEKSEHFLNVPHYGNYKPSQFAFKLSNQEDKDGESVFDSAKDENLHGASRINFYPYKIAVSDINASCPNECIPNQHGLEWRVVKSSFGAAGTGSEMQKSVLHGVEGDCITELNHPREFKTGGTADYVNQFSTVFARYKPSEQSVFIPVIARGASFTQGSVVDGIIPNVYSAYPTCPESAGVHFPPQALDRLEYQGNFDRAKLGTSYVCPVGWPGDFGAGNFAEMPPDISCQRLTFGHVSNTTRIDNTRIKGTTGFSYINRDGCDWNTMNPQDPPPLL